MEKPGTRVTPGLGAVARPWVDFPVGTRDGYRWPWLTLAL